MAALQPKQIIESLNTAFQSSGGIPYYLSDKLRSHPRKFKILFKGEVFSVWVYIWTLTHGGGLRSQNEYRIQMTSVSSPLEMNPDGQTLLLGYEPNLKVFAGFDIDKHREFTVGSPSVQIKMSALNSAIQNGISFIEKDNGEIAIGIRPDQFIVYCLNAKSLHLHGYEMEEADNLLTRAASSQDINSLHINNLTTERKRLMVTINRYSRDSRFRKTILNAYDNRCAVTRAQLGLLDAAHILPVVSEDSVDGVYNGISLSPTYHRAYDNSLIYLDEDYVMRLNQKKVAELEALNLTAGLERFSFFLNEKIHLPFQKHDWPNPEFIMLANKYRQIQRHNA